MIISRTWYNEIWDMNMQWNNMKSLMILHKSLQHSIKLISYTKPGHYAEWLQIKSAMFWQISFLKLDKKLGFCFV